MKRGPGEPGEEFQEISAPSQIKISARFTNICPVSNLKSQLGLQISAPVSDKNLNSVYKYLPCLKLKSQLGLQISAPSQI